MARDAGSINNSGRTSAVPHNGQREATNQFTALVAEKVQDGQLSPESIRALSEEVTKLAHPRDRARAKNELRAAIRENTDLSPAERREAITELNKTMAQTRPAWATASTSDVAGATANPAEKAATERAIGDTAETGGQITALNPELNRAKNAPLLLANMPLRA